MGGWLTKGQKRKGKEERCSEKKVWKLKAFIENNVFDMTQMSNIMYACFCVGTCVCKKRCTRGNNHQMVNMVFSW